MPAGKHEISIHTFGDLSNGCISAGGHYNPEGAVHGAPWDDERRVGDLGNVWARWAGLAWYHRWNDKVSLTGPNSVIGRTVVVYSGGDTYFGESGQTGPPLACGVIGWASGP